ncbi:hypothetical protein OQA88_6571 [Cercophora sp. LCS_1]
MDSLNSKESPGQQAKTVCPECRKDIPNGGNRAIFQKHIETDHAKEIEQKTAEEAKEWIRLLWKQGQQGESKNVGGVAESSPKPKVGGSGISPSNQANRKDQDPPPASKSREGPDSSIRSPSMKSQPSSLKRQGSRSRSASPPKKSKGKPTATPQQDDDRADYDRGPQSSRGGKGKLWDPDSSSTPPRPAQYDRSNVATNTRLRLSNPNSRHRQGHQPQHSAPRPPTHQDDSSTELIKQPETRPISQEQLVAEVKGIYAGLVMVETKCIEVDNAQNTQKDANSKLNNEQWQALIALHRTLLHEHHDFFLASQHPSASPALRRLASKYAMPARMWRHGIHSFLELLRHRLPNSLEHMLTFIYLAYSMMALLYETVPAFEDTWIECLGDLGRYRMAIEDDNIRDREVWTGVSRGWYSKASDKAPTTGRLYHHLAILARPNAMQQLFYYTKALCVAIPFVSARESIMTLFDPLMAPNSNQQSRLTPTEHAFVKTHGILFSRLAKKKKNPASLEASEDEFINSLDNHVGRSTRRFLEPGCFMGITNCCASVGYGSESNPIYCAIKQTRAANQEQGEEPQEQPDHAMAESGIDDAAVKELADPLRLANRTHDVIFRRYGDSNILTYVHSVLVFIHHASFYSEAMMHLAPSFPWKLLSLTLNTLTGSGQGFARFEGDEFPRAEKEEAPRPLPEDYAMRGLLWAENHFPKDWFTNDKIEDDEKGLELASMGEERRIRVLHLGVQIARQNKWLRYSKESHRFSVSLDYDVDVESTVVGAPDSVDFGELPDAAVTP